MAPHLAGILAHEAMGHPCEADLVLGGAVTGDLVGKRVASELITMVDFAHTYDGEEVSIPVYCDDEGTPARDAVLIKDGILTEFMSSRETAAPSASPPPAARAPTRPATSRSCACATPRSFPEEQARRHGRRHRSTAT